jgi:hypothetical protein
MKSITAIDFNMFAVITFLVIMIATYFYVPKLVDLLMSIN